MADDRNVAKGVVPHASELTITEWQPARAISAIAGDGVAAEELQVSFVA
jgi:hypothetical protein